MAYFPFFVELEGKRALVIGGGEVALRKIEKLLPYGPKITVVAPKMRPEIENMPEICRRMRPFVSEDLKGMDLVIAATGSRAVNHQISEMCQSRRIPVNVVDDGPECSFYFPALVKRGNLSVGISTGGSSPAAAAWLRQQIEAALPEGIEGILDFMLDQRNQVRSEIPDGKQREALMKKMFAACLERGGPLEAMEVRRLREQVGEDGK